MRLEDCNLDLDLAVSAPLTRTEPEPTWVEARESGALPDSVFELYHLAEYLSFGSAPPFLADDDNILFSYFGIILEGVLDSLAEAQEHQQRFGEAVNQTYDLGKKVRGEPWDPNAPLRARRAFRYLLLSEVAALDAVADLTAILLTGLIPRLRVGRARFSSIEGWLSRPLAPAALILTPQEHFLTELYDRLGPLVHPATGEREWLPLMRLYRNKGAHLGSSVFRQIGLHDNSGRFYTFFPRQWPYIWERHMKPAGQTYRGSTLPELFRQTLIHQDVVSYTAGLSNKVRTVVGAAALVLGSAYKQLGQLSFNQAALAELQDNSEMYAFEQFVGT